MSMGSLQRQESSSWCWTPHVACVAPSEQARLRDTVRPSTAPGSPQSWRSGRWRPFAAQLVHTRTLANASGTSIVQSDLLPALALRLVFVLDQSKRVLRGTLDCQIAAAAAYSPREAPDGRPIRPRTASVIISVRTEACTRMLIESMNSGMKPPCLQSRSK